ncbi:MAG: PDZ domain-containing protein [Pyrinomonadaceae bacterium]
MLRKLSAFILLSISTGAVVYGQQTPTEPKEPAEKRMQKTVVNALFEGSYLGIQTQEISKENFAKYGLREVSGVGVEKVIENSPAAQAGLMNGDVILKFDGEDVSSVRKLTRLISEVAPDHQAKITVLRGGSERDVNVTLGKRATPMFQESGSTLKDLYGLPGIPEYPQMPRGQFPPAVGNDKNLFVWRANSRQIGIGVTPLTKQLGDYFGIAEGEGLLINNVRENSPAAKAGLKAGDIIVEADGRQVNGNFDLTRIINEKKEGDVNLTIIRNRNRQSVKVTPEISKGEPMNSGDFEKLLESNPNQLNFRMQKPQNAPLPSGFIFNAPRIL